MAMKLQSKIFCGAVQEISFPKILAISSGRAEESTFDSRNSAEIPSYLNQPLVPQNQSSKPTRHFRRSKTKESKKYLKNQTPQTFPHFHKIHSKGNQPWPISRLLIACVHSASMKLQDNRTSFEITEFYANLLSTLAFPI